MSANTSQTPSKHEQDVFETVSLDPPAYTRYLPHRPAQPPLWRRLLRQKRTRILAIVVCLLISIVGAIGASLFLATVVQKFEFLKAGLYVVIPSSVPDVVVKSTTTMVVTETSMATMNTTVQLSGLQQTARIMATVTPGVDMIPRGGGGEPSLTPRAAGESSHLRRNRRPEFPATHPTHDAPSYYHPVVEARHQRMKPTSTPTPSPIRTAKPADPNALFELDYPRPIWGGRPGKRWDQEIPEPTQEDLDELMNELLGKPVACDGRRWGIECQTKKGEPTSMVKPTPTADLLAEFEYPRPQWGGRPGV